MQNSYLQLWRVIINQKLKCLYHQEAHREFLTAISRQIYFAVYAVFACNWEVVWKGLNNSSKSQKGLSSFYTS